MIKTKKALLIGISKYDERSIENLPKVTSDIEGLSSVLISPYISAFDIVDKILEEENKPANLEQLKYGIEEFLQNSQNEELSLIYIASHAIVSNGVLRILPADYNPQKPLSSSLPITFISSCIQNCKSESVIVILDCCYANSASWEIFSNQKIPFAIEDDERFNLCVIASTRKEEPAIDGGFTPFFIEAIERLESMDEENGVSINRIFDYTRKKMLYQLYQYPIKWEWGSHSIPIGKIYSGVWVSKSSIQEIYKTVKDKKLLPVKKSDDFQLDFIEESNTEHGFQIRTGIKILEGKPDRQAMDSAVKNINTAIDKSYADKGLVILSDDKEFLDFNSQNIRIVSFLDFKRHQDPFHVHLEKVIKDYEESEIYKLGCYINLKARSDEGKQSFILDEYILKWAASSGEINQTTVLGDYGTGKTTTSKRILWMQAKRYLENQASNRIPIFINLRNYNNKYIDQRTFIERALSDMAENTKLTYQTIQDLNRQGKLLWILDGFDEMVTCVNINLMKKNFTEILKLAQSHSRLILTCRTHFFKNKDELTDTLKGTELYDQLRQETHSQVLIVNPFTKEDINKYVQIRLKDNSGEFLNVLYDNSQLIDLASRPILLEMIVETLPKMIESKVKLNLTNLYDSYTRMWLNRDATRANMTTEERAIFCQNLAWYFFTEDKYDINYSELPEFILAQFPEEISIKYKREFLEYDVQTTTFLHRDDAGNYSFTHKSFLEFFTASYIAKQLNEDKTEELKRKIIPHEILNFLGGMLENSPQVLKNIEAISQSNKFNLKYFFRRFLKSRLFPLIRKKNATDYIHRRYYRHFLIHLGLPSIIFFLALLFYIIKEEPVFKNILFPLMPVSFVGVVLLMIFIYFVYYLLLTFFGKTGDPIINFNTLALCHFAGRKIDTTILKKRKDQLDINQEGIADLTTKVILGLPLKEKDEDKISENEHDKKTDNDESQIIFNRHYPYVRF